MLSIVGLVFIIVFAYFVFKTAKDYDRNAVGWTLACIAIGVVIQWGIPFIASIIIAIVLIATGTPQGKLQDAIMDWAIFITVVPLILSLPAMWMVIRHIAKIPDEDPLVEQLPPPPVFDQE